MTAQISSSNAPEKYSDQVLKHGCTKNPAFSLPNVISEKKVKAVNYDTKDHFSVLTQMHGSVWPSVIPYCLCNSILVIVVYHLRRRGFDLSFSDRGHTFMSMMVSFLVVTRTNIAYSRFMEARDHVNSAMRNCRELIQYAVTFTRYDTSDTAKQWRAEVARRTIVLLRTVVSVLEYQTYGVHSWKIPELTKEEKQALLISVGQSNERAPMVLTMFMRSTIASQVEYLTHPIHVNKELRLYHFVSDFVTAYHGLMKLITTPFPFPLVQMARTFLFLWVFTLPFALVNDMKKLPALILVVFFITYGFLGLEFVAIKLDNPFGDDPNDFDILGLAQVVFEDIYISIYDIDGKEAAAAIRRGLEASANVLNSQSAKEQFKRKRYPSIDAWQYAASCENVVGRDKSMLLEQSSSGGVIFGTDAIVVGDDENPIVTHIFSSKYGSTNGKSSTTSC